MKKQQTKRQGSIGEGMAGDIMLRTGMHPEEYYEKPRPSLYNIIKKLKEQDGEPLNRICYIAKVQDNYKADLEKELNVWTTNLVANDDENEFKPRGDEPPVYCGFQLIYGTWIVHLFEAENPLMGRFIRALHKKLKEPGSYYSSIHVLHYTEDVPQQAYKNWYCKSVNPAQAAKEIKSLPEIERVAHIYNSMVDIGMQS